MIRQGLVFMAAIILLSGCDRRSVYEGKKDFKSGYWVFNDPLRFDFEILDNSVAYNMEVNVRSTAKYSFQNIYLQYYLEDTTGSLLSKELKNLQLFNSVTGVPLGNGIGGVFDLSKPILEDYKFEHAGKYSLQIEQFMRQDSLPEILSVGVRVEKTE